MKEIVIPGFITTHIPIREELLFKPADYNGNTKVNL